MVKEKLEQLEKLKEEFEQLAQDLAFERRAKGAFELENNEIRHRCAALELKAGGLEAECKSKQSVIEELERRRDMAKKEIRQLYARLQKKERPAGEDDLKVRVNQDL